MCYPPKRRQRKSASTTASISQKSNDLRKNRRPRIACSGCAIIGEILPDHENGAKIIDVGSRRSRHDEIADRGIESVAVIVGELRLRNHAGRGGARQTVRIEQRAGIVLRPVDAVRIGGERVNAGMRRRARRRARAGTRRCGRRGPSRARSRSSRRPRSGRRAPRPADHTHRRGARSRRARAPRRALRPRCRWRERAESTPALLATAAAA